MQRFRNHLQTTQLLYGLLLGNICLWVFFILPNMYFKGLTNSLVSLKSNPYCFFISLSLFCSISAILCLFMYAVAYWYLGVLLASERRFVFSNFIKDNPPLILCILVIGEANRSSVETLIWSVILCYLACCKGFCIVLRSRLQDNKLKNLDEFNKLTILLTTFFLLCSIFLFKDLGFWMVLMINFECIIIYKECIQAYYQISKNKAIPGTTELALQIVDALLKILQWLQIAFSHGSLFSANPVEFLLLIKLQGYFYTLLTLVKQYTKYKSSILRFTEQYPALSSDDIAHLSDEKCCICWDTLVTGTSCKITCGHILHIECIWKWMLRNTNRKCPMCNQTFLQPEGRVNSSIFSWVPFFSRQNRRAEEDVQRLRELFPNLSEQEIQREIEELGSVQAVINSLLGD